MAAAEVIVAALAAGASAGMTSTASTAISDAYATLKNLLGKRLGTGSVAEQALEADEVEPGLWQARLEPALTASGAAGDSEVLAAAEHLLALADPSKARSFNIEVGNNYGAVGNFNASVVFNQGPQIPPSAPEAR